MKHTCEICNNELGFFERSLKIEDNRLGLNYQTLCSACHREVTLAVDKIKALAQSVKKELKGNLSKYRYASGDIHVLLFLTVKQIFLQEPDFFNPENILKVTFYPENEKTVRTSLESLVQIAYKVLREGFTPVLGRYGIETYEAFAGFVARNCLLEEQVRANCGEDGETVYADIFITQAGFIFFDDVDFIVRSIFVSKDRTVKFEESNTSSTYNLTITSQRYPELKIHPEITFNRRDQRQTVVNKLKSYNDNKSKRIEDELVALINNLNIEIEKDLRRMHPDLHLQAIPLDSVIVSSIKSLYEQDLDQDYIKEAPDGLLALLIDRFYRENFEEAGLNEADEILTYISDYCRFVTGFEVAFGTHETQPAFMFLTPSAYMIKSLTSQDTFLKARINIPNDLYCDYQNMIYQGRREFYITTSSSERDDEGYYFLSGVRIYSDKKKVLKQIEKYFKEKALDYYNSELKKELAKTEPLRETEIRNAARHIFVGFGYLPFCIYDEWASIEESIKNSDPFMESRIKKREPRTGTKNAKIFYAGKTVTSFEQEASKLAQSLDIQKLPVARAILYDALKEEILEVCAEEFIRLCGDIAGPDDSLEDLFIKYSSLTSIEPEKAYYLGLFIYYLMKKDYFDSHDFLDHYDTAAKLYIKLNPSQIKSIEFSELTVPDRRGFDVEDFDFTSITAAEPEEKEENESSYYGLQFKEEDRDEISDLLSELDGTTIVGESSRLEKLSDLIGEVKPDNEVLIRYSDSKESSLFDGVEFLDVDSEVSDVLEPADITEQEIVEEEIEEDEPEPEKKRFGFDTVRSMISNGIFKK